MREEQKVLLPCRNDAMRLVWGAWELWLKRVRVGGYVLLGVSESRRKIGYTYQHPLGPSRGYRTCSWLGCVEVVTRGRWCAS